MTASAVLEVEDLTVTFRGRGRRSRRQADVTAVDGVSFSVGPGETLGLVGESGSGKSTTARAVCDLVPYQGAVRLQGCDQRALKRRTDAARIRQMVFQDPYSSLDPLMTIGDSIAEPLRVLRTPRAGHDRRIDELLETVRLPASYANRLPRELSGGQRQRAAIARALASEPALVVCDEALSALDTSTQGEVLSILQDLRDRRELSYLFIGHDLAVVRHLADRIAVMYLGRIVESGPTSLIFGDPRHPYTQALLAAAPVPDPRAQRSRRRVALRGDTPPAEAAIGGCPFSPRCPLAVERCRVEMPAPSSRDGRTVRCHVNPV